MPDRYKGVVVMAAGTGLRQGECFGLTVDRVDFLRRTITVDRQLILLASGPPQFGPPKTAASARTVPLPTIVGESLAAHLERWPAAFDGLIFTNERGDPLRRNRFGEIWRAAVSRAGLNGLRFHDLRHFYASLLIRHGESRQGRPSPARPRLRLRDPRHLLPSMARQRGAHTGSGRAGPRPNRAESAIAPLQVHTTGVRRLRPRVLATTPPAFPRRRRGSLLKRLCLDDRRELDKRLDVPERLVDSGVETSWVCCLVPSVQVAEE
jgi:hypothetical protein